VFRGGFMGASYEVSILKFPSALGYREIVLALTT